MSLEKIERDEFLFIRYCQDAEPDHSSLRSGLEEEAQNPKDRDTVLEFVTASAIYSMEVGIIAQYVKTLRGTSRTLRFIGSAYVCEMLKTMNIHKIPNIILYEGLDALQKVYPTVDFNTFRRW